MFELGKDMFAIERRTRVIPGDRLYGRLIERLVFRNIGTVLVALPECAKGFDINLLHSPKAAELSFDPVKVPVMVTVGA